MEFTLNPADHLNRLSNSSNSTNSRMRHHCGCQFVIVTDPKNSKYVVVEGARQKVWRMRGGLGWW